MDSKSQEKNLKIRRSKDTNGAYIKEYIRLGNENRMDYVIGDITKKKGFLAVESYLTKENIEDGLRILYKEDPTFDAMQIATVAVIANELSLEKLADILPEGPFRSEIERRVKELSNPK